MRTFAVTVTCLSLSLLAIGCGGRMNPDDGCPDDRCADGGPDTGITSDTGLDTGLDGEPDVPGACGVGACVTGTTCMLDCNSCRCVGASMWECTGMACIDSGPPPPPPPMCPVYVPSDGSACTSYPGGPSLSCSYSNGCGGTTYAYCAGGRWAVKSEPCSSPTCPAYEPVEGAFCKASAKCGYTNSCGGYDTAVCDYIPDGTMRWKLYRGDCPPPPPPPPPPPSCPTTKPVSFSPCSTPMSCAWDNGCGSIAYGYCDGKYWNLKEPGCIPGCPSSKPVSGAACKPLPGAGSCSYISVPGTTCQSTCFCADDGRWACMTPPCAGTGTK